MLPGGTTDPAKNAKFMLKAILDAMDMTRSATGDELTQRASDAHANRPLTLLLLCCCSFSLLFSSRKLTRTAFGMQWNGFATRYYRIREDGPIDCSIM